MWLSSEEFGKVRREKYVCLKAVSTQKIDLADAADPEAIWEEGHVELRGDRRTTNKLWKEQPRFLGSSRSSGCTSGHAAVSILPEPGEGLLTLQLFFMAPKRKIYGEIH